MFFVAKTEDCMWRPWSSQTEKEEVEKVFRRRVGRSEKWLREFDEKGILPGSAKEEGKVSEVDKS